MAKVGYVFIPLWIIADDNRPRGRAQDDLFQNDGSCRHGLSLDRISDSRLPLWWSELVVYL